MTFDSNSSTDVSLYYIQKTLIFFMKCNQNKKWNLFKNLFEIFCHLKVKTKMVLTDLVNGAKQF